MRKIGNINDGRSVKIDNLAANDIPGLAGAFAELDPWRRLGSRQTDLERFFMTDQPGRRRMTIVVENEVAGLVVLEEPFLMGTYLRFFAIKRDSQGRGIGSIVLRDLLSEAATQGMRNFWLCASAFNKNAIEFYEYHGFEQIGVLKDLIVRGENELLYRCVLKRPD